MCVHLREVSIIFESVSKERVSTVLFACVQTSPISFVPFPRATKEIGDVCTQATVLSVQTPCI